ncbi:hypothetical protein GCM10012320_31780 [Sinomonas cellulolyticus]|uniref:Glycosidase n=1 Tax=Sinomonas cellulolyticus TaxID=2801916 RepID=A0ABS1JXT7_9MICC|nr:MULTISPECIES: glycosidase [Sinomonas]MBL0704196.1 glycosidase [Sinomonas cellulolyticus]GHG58215.1 hypothetical protein GCM10012320_31780 [Sinomonas sp. KCTC 49339]
MAKNANTAEKLDLRLKAVLDGLAGAALSGETVDARAVLTAAVDAVPFDEHEAFLLSGGIPRGHKALTTATAKLVKAGWMVKGRSGWAITEEGLRATVAFPTAQALAEALAAGTPVPEGTPVPTEPPAQKKTRKAPAKKKAAAQPVEAAEPVVAEAAATETSPGDSAEADSTAPGAVDLGQPDSVAIAGDFAQHLGAHDDWEPRPDAVQMGLDATSRRWVRTVDLPAGHYAFKIAINRSWDENYGAFGTFNGANHELVHDGGTVTIAYDHDTKDVAFS